VMFFSDHAIRFSTHSGQVPRRQTEGPHTEPPQPTSREKLVPVTRLAVLRILDLKPTGRRCCVVVPGRPLRHDPLEILAAHFREEIPATAADVVGVKCHARAARNERPKSLLSLDECHLPYVEPFTAS
jgi:hypothetical protein